MTAEGQALALVSPEGMDRDDRVLFINRELSWLEFNRRVLEEAQHPLTPSLEEAPLRDRVHSSGL